jgi:hypothetical protein
MTKYIPDYKINENSYGINGGKKLLKRKTKKTKK